MCCDKIMKIAMRFWLGCHAHEFQGLGVEARVEFHGGTLLASLARFLVVDIQVERLICGDLDHK